jgi:hypothetical protein
MASERTLRIYSETLPLERVARPDTLALLARHGLSLVLAVRPWQVAELPAVARALRDAGVPLAVWPMLGDEEGRWANARNASSFGRLARAVVAALDDARAPASEVLLDLEPPFSEAKDLSHGARGLLRIAMAGQRALIDQSAFASSAHELAALVAELHAAGVATSAAVWPLVALDPPGASLWQSLLGTPTDRLATSRVSVMLYTSILEGWSRGAFRRAHALELLAAGTLRAQRRWGPSAGVSLGCVGTGAFDDEPIYRDPHELAEDTALAAEAGCLDVSLFDLGGVLGRAPAEAWLEAFVHGADMIGAGVRSRIRELLAPDGRSQRVLATRRFARLATRLLTRR